MRGLRVVLIAAVCVPLVLLTTGPSSADDRVRATATPQVGDCYDVSDVRLQAGGWWTDTPAVACTQPHTFEVTETGILPADVDAFVFAADRCGPLDVWTAVGVNMPVAGIVENPLRVEPRSFAVRSPPASYVCGAVALTLNGREPASAVSMTTSLERMGRRTAAALRYCSSAGGDRRATAPAITVPCSTRPRWQVVDWIMWTAFYDGYPGRAELKARADELCGERATATVPTASAWEDGLPRTWCYRLYP